jgi:hypothetical protein
VPSNELQELRKVFQGLQTLYQLRLPKISPALIQDFLIRKEEEFRRSNNKSKSSPPFYMVEIATTKITDAEK